MAKAHIAYMDELRRRGRKSHVYRKYQLFGLEISQALRDEKHKSLYIKLAKEKDGERLLRLAKDVADRKNIKNPGAYFMTLLKNAPRTAPKHARRNTNR